MKNGNVQLKSVHEEKDKPTMNKKEMSCLLRKIVWGSAYRQKLESSLLSHQWNRMGKQSDR